MLFSHYGHAICGDETPTILGVFDFSTVPPLLFYSYIPIVVVSLAIGFLIYRKDKNSLLSRLLFFMTIFFTLWVINILVQWIASYHTVLMLGWQLTAFFEVSLFLVTTYLAYVFIYAKDIPPILKWVGFILGIALATVLPTSFNIAAYDAANCEGVVGPLWNGIYILEPALIVLIAGMGVSQWRKERTNKARQRQIAVFTTGLVLLLSTFFASNFYGELTKVYEFNLWGPLGMLVFFILLAYMIIRYHTFNIKLFGTQALVLFITLLIGSKLFYNTNTTDTILNGTTLVFFIISGTFLIRSVRAEIKQKERLQKLTEELRISNEKLKSLDKLKSEFISLASHQLRSPLTAIKGYASMLYEGSFGPMSDKQVEGAKRIYTSAQGLTNIVEDLLNVTKIEQGGMKYEFIATDLGKLVTDLYAEMKVPAESKHLEFTLDLPRDEIFMISADPVKLKQVFLNLVDNSLKYTQKGFVRLALKRDGTNIVFTVTDSGMGITPEVKAKLFEKFNRGDDKTNTGGSGLGLYLAREIARAHKGDVVIDSPGLGQGSTFTVTLPATGLPR